MIYTECNFHTCSSEETSETHETGNTRAGKEVQLDKQGTDRGLGWVRTRAAR